MWPTFLRNNLGDRLHVSSTLGAHWAQDKYRKILTRALQLFGKLSFATLQDSNGLRHKVALQIVVQLNHLPDLHTQHIPHASKARLPKELAIPITEVLILVERVVRKTTENMGNMRGQVLRLLERGTNGVIRNG